MPTPLLSSPRIGLCTRDAQVPLQHVDVRADIRDAQARVTCTQRYRNQESHPVEAIYVFPIDEGAAVCGFAAVVGGVRYEGAVKSRDQAFATYDDAIAEGHGAFLLDEERPDVFTASIGNLAPGMEVRIEVAYVVELPYEGEAIRFTLPTTVSPRYAPAEDRVGIGPSPSDVLNPPRALDVSYGLSFCASLSGGSRIQRVESPSHPIAVDFDGQRAHVTLSQAHVALDRDLVLLITHSESAAPRVVLERTTTGRIAAAVTFNPTFETERAPIDVVFLVDRSGSMEGSSIEQVRNALQLCLRSLRSGCAFDIVGFGSRFESLFDECRSYDERSLADASRHVESLEADLGGTEILPALEFVLEHRLRQRSLQLVVLTDGQITNTDAVLDAARRYTGRIRTFTFGIGRGASHHLVKSLARVGGGACDFVYPGERLEAKVVRLFRRAMSPALTDVHLEWVGTHAVAVPATVGPIFAGEPLRAYAWIDKPASSVTLQASSPNGPLSWSIDLQPVEVTDANLVGALAARARIREIEEGGRWVPNRGSQQRQRKAEGAVKEIVSLAIEYGLASRETSWVVVEKREVPVLDEMALRRIPVAITSGWGALDAPVARLNRRLKLTMDLTDSFDPGQLIGFGGSTVLEGDPLELRGLGEPMPSSSLFGGLVGRFRRGRTKKEGESGPVSKGSSTRALDRLVALQRADGSWDLDEALADVLGVSLPDLVARIAAVRGDTSDVRRAWATALALAFLERHASSSRLEWELLADKARSWLAGVSVRPSGGGSWLDLARADLV